MNAAGVIVGAFLDSTGLSRAAVFENGGITQLACPTDGHSYAIAINNAGQIAGYCPGASGGDGSGSRATIWHKRQPRILPAPEGYYSDAMAMNASGHVAGSVVEPTTGIARAAVWKNGTLLDLNIVLPPNSGWELIYAFDINDSGAVVGTGLLNGVYPSYLLVPPPNTPVGDDVIVNPEVTLPGGSPIEVSLAFENVIAPGATTVTATADAPAAPSGFKVAGTYFDIATTQRLAAMCACA